MEDLEYRVLAQKYGITGYSGDPKETSKSNTTKQETYLTEGYLRIPSESLT